jgi:hypothetical protein
MWSRSPPTAAPSRRSVGPWVGRDKMPTRRASPSISTTPSMPSNPGGPSSPPRSTCSAGPATSTGPPPTPPGRSSTRPSSPGSTLDSADRQPRLLAAALIDVSSRDLHGTDQGHDDPELVAQRSPPGRDGAQQLPWRTPTSSARPPSWRRSVGRTDADRFAQDPDLLAGGGRRGALLVLLSLSGAGRTRVCRAPASRRCRCRVQPSSQAPDDPADARHLTVRLYVTPSGPVVAGPVTVSHGWPSAYPAAAPRSRYSCWTQPESRCGKRTCPVR